MKILAQVTSNLRFMLMVLSFILILQQACVPDKIFTEIDFSFKNLEDVFPAEFNRSRAEIRELAAEKNQSFEKGLVGIYGSLASLSAWQNENSDQAKRLFNQIHTEQKALGPKNYSLTQSKEYRYNYTGKDGINGMLWTNKSYLFQIEAKDKPTMLDFLKLAKLIRID